MATRNINIITTPNYEAIKWCWSHGIEIYSVPEDPQGKTLKIAVKNKNKLTIGKEVYTSVYDVARKTNELYTIIYEQNKKKNDEQ